MAAWVAPAVMAGMSVLDQLMNQGGNTQTGSTQVTPAPWSAVGAGGEPMWDDFVMNFFGGDMATEGLGKINNEIAYLESLRDSTSPVTAQPGRRPLSPRERFEQGGSPQEMQLLDGMTPAEVDARLNALYADKDRLSGLEGQPSFEDRLTEDIDYQRGLADTFLGDMTGADSAYKGSAQQATGDFNDILREMGSLATTPTMQVGVGGQVQNIIPKRNILAGQTGGALGKDAYLANMGLAKDVYGIDTGAAQRGYEVNSEFTPNKSYMTYMDKIWPMLSQMQGWRFGLPSETGTLSYTPDWLDRVGQYTEIGQNVGDWLSSIDSGNQNVPGSSPWDEYIMD